MSNGFLLAADADLSGVDDIASGFGLDAVGAGSFGSHQAAAAAMQGASNVGIVLSHAATRDASFVALLHVLANSLRSAQLILDEPDARAAFAFLPDAWPTMALADARARANDLLRRRSEAAGEEPPRAQPLPPAEEAPPPIREQPEAAAPAEPPAPKPEPAPEPEPTPEPEPSSELAAHDDDAVVGGAAPGAPEQEEEDNFGGGEDLATETAQEPPPPPASVAPAPQAAEPPREPARTRAAPAESAPADATAFAPKKLRRGSPELVRIVIHQPKDLKDVIKAARQIDPRTEAAPSGMKVGDVALGSSVGVSLEVRGAACDGEIQRRTWQGEPLDFNFSAEAEADVKQTVFLARVFIDDAQIGVLAFTRPVGGPKRNPASNDRVRLKRHKRVFLSYSSKDRETVSAIATAYEAAGVQHFFDRTSLKSGEEWSPRLRQEIDRADLFHLCWSRSAAESEWVEKEAEHALTRRRRSNGKKPDITVQMLDGPPWAKHPDSLDSINFDDFVRAAIVGYARGDGQS
ncbi:MAG: toll/interleukin-1 receptor domain-containing protein [Hyphomonadaceae bacterium]